MFLLNVIGKGAEPGLFRGLDNGPARILSPAHAFDLPVAETEALAEASARAGVNSPAEESESASAAGRASGGGPPSLGT